MKSNLASVLSGLMMLALAGACEELLPAAMGVGFPFLMALAAFGAVRRPLVEGLVLAFAAGAMEDALSGISGIPSASFFVALAWFARRDYIPTAGLSLTYPCYLIWLAVWTGGLGDGAFNRILFSMPIGAVTFLTAGLVAHIWAPIVKKEADDARA